MSTLSAPSASTAGVFARAFSPTPEKLEFLLDKAVQHRPWFDDYTWADAALRRDVARKYLAENYFEMQRGGAFLWEVWHGADLVGIFLLTDVRWRTDAQCHFLFFDRKLANKRALCLNLMALVFEQFALHRLRLEVPEYAHALAEYARNKLGFRYEAEGATLRVASKVVSLTGHDAGLLSRKFRATLYNGTWQDVLLLTVTREEFATFYAAQAQAPRLRSALPDGPLDGPALGVPPKPGADASALSGALGAELLPGGGAPATPHG